MGKTAQKYLNLKNLELLMGSGLVVDAIRVRIKRNPKFVVKPSGMAMQDQSFYNGEARPDIVITCVNSDDLSFGDIIPNDPVVDFALTSPNDADASILQDDFFTKWPITAWVFGDPGTEYDGEKASEFEIPIIAGCLNPNEVVVEP